VKQVNADISGADRKEIIKSLDDKMAKTVSRQVSQHYYYKSRTHKRKEQNRKEKKRTEIIKKLDDQVAKTLSSLLMHYCQLTQRPSIHRLMFLLKHTKA
jgi:hypothetical protein